MIDIHEFFKVENKNVDLIRYGPKQEFGYVVPNLSYTKCITIGVGDSISFEEELSRKKNVEFFLFDHTIRRLPQCLDKSVFHRIGLGNGDKLLPLTPILDMCSLTDDDITLLKMDCEGGEWESEIHFTDLSKISAIVVELHDLDNFRRHRHYSTILKHISNDFTLINIHGNNFSHTFTHNGIVIPNVLELTYISNKKLNYCLGSYVDLNYPNDPRSPDVRLTKIPKIIHTSWMSGDPLGELQEKCLKSWKTILPDYEIKIWDSTNWDVSKYRFTSEAFLHKHWAFVSDVVRLDVVYEHGGIWLDLDVEILCSLDRFLEHKYFTGSEPPWCGPSNTPYIFGAESKNPLIKELLDYYNERPFIIKRNFDKRTNTNIIGDILVKNHRVLNVDTFQEFKDEYMRYPSNILGFLSKDTVALHHAQGHWRYQPNSVGG